MSQRSEIVDCLQAAVRSGKGVGGIVLEIEYTGHAGFIVRGKERSLILDPWVSAGGAFDNSWYQMPCNHHLKQGMLEKFNARNSLLYISHLHQDHFDREFLKEVDKDTPILIPKFESRDFVQELDRLGFAFIREIEDSESIAVSGFAITVFVDDRGLNRDSAILVRKDSQSFLNLNDCKIFDRLHHIQKTFGDIDVYSVQFSGASWHPVTYQYTADEFEKLCRKKKNSKFATVLNSLKLLSPRHYIPSAGPACFLDPDLRWINEFAENSFPSKFEFIDYLTRKGFGDCVLDMNPGDVFCTTQDKFSQKLPATLSRDNYQQYIEEYARSHCDRFTDRKRFTGRESLEPLFARLRQALTQKVRVFDPPDFVECVLYFSLFEQPDRYIRIDLNAGTVEETDHIDSEKYYCIAYPAWQIARLLDGAISWEDLSLTFRARVKRNPDQYNTYVNGFLYLESRDLPKFIDKVAALKANTQRVDIQHDDKTYEIARFCPHQGADLKYGWADEGCWVCPRHRWMFDLDSGNCVNSDDTIFVRETVPAADRDKEKAPVAATSKRGLTIKRFTPEEKVRIVLAGLRDVEGVPTLCRREGISLQIYNRWSEDFVEAGKKRLMGVKE